MKQNYKLVIMLLVLSIISYTAYTKPLKKSNLQEADEAYAQNNLTQAEELYLKVLTKTPDHYLSNARLGSLYLGINQPAKSVAYLKKALEMHKGYSPELNRQLSVAYQLSADFDNAITLYYDLLKREKKNSPQVAVYQKKINECISGKQLMANPAKIKINNLGALVNSARMDHVPVLTANDKTILFTSQRSRDAKKPTAVADEDIYLISQQADSWSSPTRLSQPFNTRQHEAILAVTAEGKKMYLYSSKNRKGDIYESQSENNIWKAPVKLCANINTRHRELSFMVSSDGNYAFFSSDRPGGYGGLDLYMSIAEGNGKWSKAINLGPNINTAYDEDAPFLSADNNVLYFSSRGHNAMGGYDIFKSTINGAVWSVAQNLGVPVNSPYDDAFYVQTQDGKMAYFSSDRPGGFGENDIYSVAAETEVELADAGEYTGVFTAMLDSEKSLASGFQVTQNPTIPVVKSPSGLKGFILDAITCDTLNARITLLNKTLYTTEQVLETMPGGSFELMLEADRNYGLLIESNGYHFRSQNLVIPASVGTDTLSFVVTLRQDSTATALTLQNVHFYPNHDYIKSYSLAELDWLYTYLLDNPRLNAVITDYLNEDDTIQYKKKLNKKRAASVIKYLDSKGLEPGRVSYHAKNYKKLPLTSTQLTGMVINLEQED